MGIGCTTVILPALGQFKEQTFQPVAPQLYVFVSIVLPGLVLPHLRPGRSSLLPELGLRAAAVTTSFLLAALVPYLDLFISLAGALCMSTLSLVCPAIIGNEMLKVH